MILNKLIALFGVIIEFTDFKSLSISSSSSLFIFVKYFAFTNKFVVSFIKKYFLFERRVGVVEFHFFVFFKKKPKSSSTLISIGCVPLKTK